MGTGVIKGRGQGSVVTPPLPTPHHPSYITVLPKLNFKLSILVQIWEVINISTKDHRKLTDRKYTRVNASYLFMQTQGVVVVEEGRSIPLSVIYRELGLNLERCSISPKGNFTNQYIDHNGLGGSGISNVSTLTIISWAARYDCTQRKKCAACGRLKGVTGCTVGALA